MCLFQAMNAVMQTWQDGPYIFIVKVDISPPKDGVNIKGTHEELPNVMASSDQPKAPLISEPCVVHLFWNFA